MKNRKKILEEFIEDDSFAKKSSNLVNFYDFKTPTNLVIATAEPEYKFLRKYLCINENSQKIKSWIKSRDMGFYSIEYSYKMGSHTKQGTFNPDFIIKIDSESEELFVVIEIKEDNDVSLENKGKYRFAKDHFELLNTKLKENSINERYLFHFLSPEDYDVFFKYLREDKLDSFVSGLDNSLEDISK